MQKYKIIRIFATVICKIKKTIMKKLFVMLMLAAAVTVGCAQSGGDDLFVTIEVDGFHHTLENSSDDCVLLDVRTPAEYKEGHLKGAINIDVKDSINFMKRLWRFCLRKRPLWYIAVVASEAQMLLASWLPRDTLYLILRAAS